MSASKPIHVAAGDLNVLKSTKLYLECGHEAESESPQVHAFCSLCWGRKPVRSWQNIERSYNCASVSPMLYPVTSPITNEAI